MLVGMIFKEERFVFLAIFICTIPIVQNKICTNVSYIRAKGYQLGNICYCTLTEAQQC